MTPQDIREAVKMAEEDALDILDEQAAIFAPDGLTWDMEELNDREFILWYLDLGQTPSPEFNTLMFLPEVNPQLDAQLRTRFERAVGKAEIGAR